MNTRDLAATNGPLDGSQPPARLIAFHLPQYHPIPENDAWWGKGFTEWTNVTKAQPQFPGHYQPHLPADLGFYDLRLPEVRAAQAELAQEYGIHGFCYYHYWFGGKRLLERPVAEILASGEPVFPFCLCWANENWTRRWDGKERDILMQDQYSAEDDLAHLRWLAEAFQDHRYIRIDDKPLFLVYRASRLPDQRRTTEIWREEALRLGIGELFLCRVESFPDEQVDPRPLGFDASVEFAPEWNRVGSRQRPEPVRWWQRRRTDPMDQARELHNIFEYEMMARLAEQKTLPDYELLRCTTPMWDNCARRQADATIFVGSTPERYERWLRFLIEQAQRQPPEHRIVFINAWNEWAEGNHLEPDQQWGRAYLEATRRALAGLGTGEKVWDGALAKRI